MKDLCVYIPTRNNPELMKFFLQTVEADARKYDVDIWIYDTSDTSATKDIADGFTELNIHYVSNDTYPDKTTDLKIIEIYPQLVKEYKYIWLCGDGHVPNIGNVIPQIKEYTDAGMDVIQFIDKKNVGGRSGFCTGNVEYFKECGWFATLYGGTIVSSGLYRGICWNDYDEFRNTGFLYWYVLFTALSMKESRIAVLDLEGSYTKNPFKKTNASYRPNGFTRFWIKAWPMVIDKLPDCYNEYKGKVCKDMGNYSGLYTGSGLLRLRVTQNITFGIVRENKKNIRKVTDVPLWKFYLFSLMPAELLLAMKKLKKFIKK